MSTKPRTCSRQGCDNTVTIKRKRICENCRNGKPKSSTKRCQVCTATITSKSHTKYCGNICVKYNKDKKHAINNRGKTWSITIEHFKLLVTSKCYYCLSEPADNDYIQEDKEGKLNGIDRYVNNIGYEPGNCVPCCTFCNMGKGEKLAANFERYVNRMLINRLEEAKKYRLSWRV